MNSITLRASQTTIAYREAGTGPVVVLLHAFPFDSEMWRGQQVDLASTCRVIAPDIPGAGESPLGAGVTIEGAAELVAELLDHLGIDERVTIGGLSMGGYVALAFARLYPQRLRALILADTKAEPDDASGREARNSLIELATTQGAKAVIERLLPKILSPKTLATRPESVSFVRELAQRQSVPGIVAALQALRDRPDATEGLSHISVPSLVIVGSADAVTPLEKARVLAGAIPNARLAELTDCGHLSNIEDPAAFTVVVKQFLDTLPNEVRSSRTV